MGNYWVYETNHMEGMMLEKLFGRPEYLITLEVFNRYTRIDFYSSVFCYILGLYFDSCMVVKTGKMYSK